VKNLEHKFVDIIPNVLEDNVIYISIKYRTVVHKCLCGCGNEVVTPISPTDWELVFNGNTISLFPSIGNWNFDCKSHYWITKNEVEWDGFWSRDRILMNREEATLKKRKYYGKKQSEKSSRNKGKWFKFLIS
jgi:hypothetical protein